MKRYYLKDFNPYRPFVGICNQCEVETTFSGFMRIRLDTHAVHHHQYQCQSCGKLTYSDVDIYGVSMDENQISHELVRVAMDQNCECGGQFRRDKNIFCPACLSRHDTEHNCRDDDNLFIRRDDSENLN